MYILQIILKKTVAQKLKFGFIFQQFLFLAADIVIYLSFVINVNLLKYIANTAATFCNVNYSA